MLVRESLARPSLSTAWVLGTLLAAAAPPPAPPVAPPLLKPQDVIVAMIANENAAAARSERYLYLSNERSGRTGGHVWTERVLETPPGRMRLLLAIDGKPLSPQQAQQERSRLEGIRDHPEVFIKHEQSNRAEEKRARDLLEVLPKDYIFENVVLDHGLWRMSFRPNPDYKPSGIQERVLHNMAGTLVIDAQDLRLVHMDFHVTQEVGIGFGLLAELHQGSNFASDRQKTDGRWHTVHVATEVRAKAVLFKNVELNLDLYRSEFEPLDHEYSVPDAATRLLNLK